MANSADQVYKHISKYADKLIDSWEQEGRHERDKRRLEKSLDSARSPENFKKAGIISLGLSAYWIARGSKCLFSGDRRGWDFILNGLVAHSWRLRTVLPVSKETRLDSSSHMINGVIYQDALFNIGGALLFPSLLNLSDALGYCELFSRNEVLQGNNENDWSIMWLLYDIGMSGRSPDSSDLNLEAECRKHLSEGKSGFRYKRDPYMMFPHYVFFPTHLIALTQSNAAATGVQEAKELLPELFFDLPDTRDYTKEPVLDRFAKTCRQ